MKFFVSLARTATTLVCLFISAPVTAHSPYFSSQETISENGYEGVSLKLLHGDGIFFADPIRAVIVNKDGILLAVSAMSPTLEVFCGGSQPSRKCVIYDALARAVYEPKPSDWQYGETLEIDGRPKNYPEMMDADFGFTKRSASALEIIRFEVIDAVEYWWITALVAAWWALFWLMIIPVGLGLVGRRSGLTIVSGILRLIGAVLMLLPTALFWLQAPYSCSYLAIVLALGALLATFLQRVGRRKVPS